MARFTYIPNRVIDTDGISDGANIYFYATGTTTPITVYSDSALTTPVSNPYPVASGAAVPSLYYAEQDIRVRVIDSSGAVISDDDPWSAVEADAVYTDGGDTVQELLDGYATRTALKAATSYAGARVFLTEAGRDGEFVFRLGNYSAAVAADTQEGIYIKADDKATTVGAWVRVFDGPVNVKWFGATADGSTDDSAAFAGAVASGRSIFVPAGTYKAAFDLGDNQMIFGEGGKEKSIIKPPAGATYCIRIDATSSAKEHCQIRNISLINSDSVANCVGLLFNATDVNTINDWHTVANVFIQFFARGIEVLGRQIWSSYYNVEIVNATVGLNVSTDTTTPAFNQNTFVQCRFAGCADEGTKIVGQNTTIGWYTCNWELCNQNNTAGVAAVDVEDSEQMSFIGCYLESNGSGVAVDTGTISNNSIGIKFDGLYCYNAKIEQCFIVGSGILVWVAANPRGGVLENSRLDPIATGYSLYITAALNNIGAAPFTYDSSNLSSGKLEIVQDVNGNYTGRVSQSSASYWMTATETPDLVQTSKLIVNPNGTTFTGITAISNRIPGMELTVWNESGANSFTIDAALIYKGSGVVAAQTSKRYFVGGFPANGKLIEV